MLIVQLGLGGVGRTLVRQLLNQRATLARRYGMTLDYLGLADSSGALGGGSPLTPSQLLGAVEAKAAGRSLAELPGGRAGAGLAGLLPDQPCVIVDVTAAEGTTAALIAALGAGHRAVLANKRPLSGSWEQFQALTAGGRTRYEATVGAGLPVLSTLQALLDSGDGVQRVEACLSGTLGFLCTALDDGSPLSAAVREAHARGYTEPDPRDDLSGADVARKALILARTFGLPWPAEAIRPEPLFPPALAALSRDEFMARLAELDGPIAAQAAEARASGSALRYVATVGAGSPEVGLRALPLAHPLAGLRGPDNMFSFITERYAERPLVVRGPGAGLDVTAAGVLADIVATAREMVALSE